MRDLIACHTDQFAKEWHFFDYLAPMAWFLDIPLYAFLEEEEFTSVKTWYPGVDIRRMSSDLNTLKDLLKSSKAVLNSCFFSTAWGEWIERLALQKELQHLRFVHLPHGNSDKGRNSWWLEKFLEEDICYVYGKRMENFLREKKVWQRLEDPLFIGNFRKSYYEHFKDYYDDLIKKTILEKFPEEKPYYLYAPTWFDWENSTTLKECFRFLRNAPKDKNILVKLHPNTERRNPVDYLLLKAKVDPIPNIQLLSCFPPVYPVLANAKLYMGDLSSVGYDAMSMGLPLFFLEHKELRERLYIHKMGTSIAFSDYEKAFEIIEKELPFDQERFRKKRLEGEAYTYCTKEKEQAKKELKSRILKGRRLSLKEIKQRLEQFMIEEKRVPITKKRR